MSVHTKALSVTPRGSLDESSFLTRPPHPTPPSPQCSRLRRPFFASQKLHVSPTSEPPSLLFLLPEMLVLPHLDELILAP
jgi:hypothetical protein